MEELQKYVANGLPQDKAIIEELDNSIRDVLDMFSAFEETTKHIWPYWILDANVAQYRYPLDYHKRLSGGPEKEFSQSTVAMIAAAIQGATNLSSVRHSSGYDWTERPPAPFAVDGAPASRLAKLIGAAHDSLMQRWLDPSSDGSKEGNCSQSSTFGKNDILTLSWHLDIFTRNAGPASREALVFNGCRDKVIQRAINFAKSPSGHAGARECFQDDGNYKRQVSDSAYNLLRFIRCVKHIDEASVEADTRVKIHRAKDRCFIRMRSHLHDQLSYSEIQDSPFDPAELVFCLEGMLHLRRESVDVELMKRILAVLSKSQAALPYWHSNIPMVADHNLNR